MTIDQLQKKSPEPWMLSRLHRWCAEWALDQAIQEPTECASYADTARPDVEACVRPAQPLRPDIIALLAPLRGEPDLPPLYVAILGVSDSDTCVCIPYGRFSEPATPGELLSGEKTPALRVLCLWNARRLASPCALCGWVVRHLSGDEKADMRKAYASVSNSAALPEELLRSGGPPLFHPEDPRRAYLHDSRALVDRYLACIGRAATYRLPEHDHDALPRAAEDREPYGTGDDPLISS